MRKSLVILFCLIHLILSFSWADSLPEDTSRVNKKKLAAIISTESTLYLGSMAYLQFVWYKDSERVPFQFYNDNAG